MRAGPPDFLPGTAGATSLKRTKRVALNWQILTYGLYAVLIVGCEDESKRTSPTTIQDMHVDATSVPLDTHTSAPDQGPLNQDAATASTDGFTDVGLNEECEWPRIEPTLIGPPDGPRSPKTGVTAFEQEGWNRARTALMANPHIHFVGTYLRDSEEFVVFGGLPDGRAEVRFILETAPDGGVRYTVTEGDLNAIFPSQSVQLFGSMESLLDAFVNPLNTQIPNRGYRPDDPRVGFIPAQEQSYPRALERLATLFNSVDGPDFVYGEFPWANGGTGTHGGLSLLQSRAALLLSGPGLKRGVVLDEEAALVDIAPTALALLGSSTTAGQGSRGAYSDGLYLARQDGRVLYEAFEGTSCERPERIVIIVFDGLQSGELNAQLSSDVPDVDLPHFRALAESGVTYRYGALAGFPSYSAPGHTTVGTGAWPGHHGMIANTFYGRAESDLITPFDLLSDLPRFIQDPEAPQTLYDRLVSGPVENLAQAAHRGLGRYNAGTGEGAFVAVVNEITFPDADFSTLSFFNGGTEKSLLQYRLADNLAMTQLDTLLDGQADYPVPTLLHLSFLATDAAGESDGPHSDLVREVLVELDEKVGRLMDAYAARDALEGTLFILTADHGMELQDAQRRVSVRSLLNTAGVRTDFVQAGLVYLRSIDLNARVSLDGQTLHVSVLRGSNDAPIPDALVRSPELNAEARTDAEGHAQLSLPPGSNGVIELVVEHTGFNAARLSFSLDNGP